MFTGFDICRTFKKERKSMNKIITTTLKLLFRNKGFWFFLLLTPALSLLLFSMKSDSLSMYLNHSCYEIAELKDDSVKATYCRVDNTLCVKVYDGSESQLSEYFLKRLTGSGMFTVCRKHTPELSRSEASKRVDEDVEKDGMEAILYLSPDFDREAATGNLDEAIGLYQVSGDPRIALLLREVKTAFSDITAMSQSYASADEAAEALIKRDAELPVKEVVSVTGKNEVSLTEEQVKEKTRIGYAFAILSLGFVFSGIFVAYSVIEEQRDKVLLRINLSGTRSIVYFTAKFITSIITSLMLTLVLALYITIFKSGDFLIGKLNLIILVFLMGVIFCSISLLLGVLIGNAMSANYAAFTIWSLSSLLSGLYFPLSDTKNAVKMISYMMPQKWFMDSTDQIFTGDSKGYYMVLCITAAYLVIIISLGGAGLKLKKNEA